MTYDTINNVQTIAGNSEGTILANRYRVVRQLGQGGMGSVWLAEDTQLDNKLFAIKMLPAILVANKRAYRQLKEEALVAMRLVHPNIVQIRAFEENNGNPFLVMDYIDGQTLDDYLAEKGKLSEDEVIRVLCPIAAALDYAHAKGVVHRDVKPGNVMIAKDGTPYILDFGIAREIQETLTRVTGKLSSGTLLYMSPEQLHGAQPKKEQDIYSFAAMVYECLKGEPPFVRGQIEYQIDHDVPEPLADVGTTGSLPVGVNGQAVRSTSIAASVMAGLAKKPEDRPPTCAAVLVGDEVVSRRGAEAQRDLNSPAETVERATPTAPQTETGLNRAEHVERVESVGRGAPTAPKTDIAGRACTPLPTESSPLPAENGRARSPSGPQSHADPVHQERKTSGAWKVFLGVALLGLAIVGVQKFFGENAAKQRELCISNLRQITGAIEMCQISGKKPTPERLYGPGRYISHKLTCPLGGHYKIIENGPGYMVVCPHADQGHRLSDPPPQKNTTVIEENEQRERQETVAREKAAQEARDRARTTCEKAGRRGYLLWEGGPYWATTNIGAERPEDRGYYFWWGDTVGYKWENNAWVASDGSSYDFSFGSENTPTSNQPPPALQREGWITADNVLVPEHDAAHIHWGGGWRMPTSKELDDLRNKCDWTWTTTNGVNGYVVRGRNDYASNSIFLPCAGLGRGTSLHGSGSHGDYWSSVPGSDVNYSWYLFFRSSYRYTYINYRFDGFSVRPVQGFTK